MAEGGLTRPQALEQAKAMLGVNAPELRLPESERRLIQLALATVGKWRVVSKPMGGAKLLGFDLSEIDVATRWLGIAPDPALLDGLGIIERAALKVLEAT